MDQNGRNCADWLGLAITLVDLAGNELGEVAERLKAPHSKCGILARVSRVRIPPSPPFQSLRGHRVCATVRHERLEQPGLRSHDTNLAFGDLDALGERAKMVTAVATAFEPYTLARGTGEFAEHLQRDCLAP